MFSLANTPREFYPNQTFSPASPLTQAGLYGSAAAGGQMLGMGDSMRNSWERGLNASDVANNPYVNSMMDVNAQKVNQNLQRNLMPGIQQGAVQSGGMNNSRQGIAQGVAMGDTQQGLANANAQTQLGAYGQGLSHEQAMMGQAGNIQNAYLNPWQVMGQAGQGIESYQQKAIDDDMARFNFDRNDADMRLNSLIAQLGGMKYGTQTGTNSQMNPNYQSPLMTGLQTAAGLGGMAMGIPAAGGKGTMFGNWISNKYPSTQYTG